MPTKVLARKGERWIDHHRLYTGWENKKVCLDLYDLIITHQSNDYFEGLSNDYFEGLSNDFKYQQSATKSWMLLLKEIHIEQVSLRR